MLVQLPDDAVSVGYREVRPYHFEQVFSSESADFTGTEREFIQNGHAYGYIQIDEYTRHVLKTCSRAGTSY